MGEALLVYNWSTPSISDCIFLRYILKIKPNYISVSSTWWPLNRGDNNGRCLVGTAKRWLRSLTRDGRLISHSFLQLFWDFCYWPLNGGSTVYRFILTIFTYATYNRSDKSRKREIPCTELGRFTQRWSKHPWRFENFFHTRVHCFLS